MAKTSTVVWSLIGTVIAVLGMLGLIYGPEMIRQGKAFVGPIVDIATSEDRLAELNRELPFDEPADGTVGADRFAVFLEIRRDLLPRYLEWQAVERRLEKGGQEDWESAVGFLEAIQSVMTFQIETLRTHGMSPAEFIWIEDQVYVAWGETVEDLIQGDAVTEAIREVTAADLQTLAGVEARYGASLATKEIAAGLNSRLDSLDNPGAPTVEGVSDANSSLFWAHRREVVELDFAKVSRLHKILRGQNDIDIKIDGEREG
jgi:hypothetical protein